MAFLVTVDYYMSLCHFPIGLSVLSCMLLYLHVSIIAGVQVYYQVLGYVTMGIGTIEEFISVVGDSNIMNV